VSAVADMAARGLDGSSEAARDRRPRARRLPEGALRWVASFALVLALHAGAAAYVLSPSPEVAEGAPDDAIEVDLVPDPSDQTAKPDEVAGPDVAEAAQPTSEQTQADDPEPPPPHAPPPTEVKRKPDVAAPEATAPETPTEAEAVLPPDTKTEQKAEDRPPDPTPPVEKTPDAKEDTVERQTAPSQASTGSVALLGGGRRPSAAAQATWRGAIGTHLVRHRRYPQEARDRHMQGTARVRVTINAEGHVIGRELAQSSGRPLLDGEALALMQRSDPFPKPPPGMPTPVVLTVPVNFAIR
jgi:periplasmic protein TonB